jgi:hypothetical protein
LVAVVMADELALDDGPHRIAFSGRGALPEDTETLAADGALNVLFLFGSFQ